jgi:two-component system KDP operon response regulator KdpE
MANQPAILLVEDEAEIRNMLTIFLGVEDMTIKAVETGKAGLREIVGSKPDLVVLDLGLPDLDGQEVIAQVRKFSHVPIIVLTARSDDDQVVKALNAGADDYVVKPFRAEILLARIQANLRNRVAASEPDHLENGPIAIDLARHEVRLDGELTAFTPKEFALLEYFLVNRGRMLTHKQILGAVWGPAHKEDTQYLRVYIGQVRAKLERVKGLGACIVSESGIGYRMETLGVPTAAVAAE